MIHSLPMLFNSDIVYRIDCKDYNASYVDQTDKCLKVRMSEHRNHINRNTTQSSVVTDHRIETSYDFEWDNIKILDKAQILNKRLLLEMIYDI